MPIQLVLWQVLVLVLGPPLLLVIFALRHHGLARFLALFCVTPLASILDSVVVAAMRTSSVESMLPQAALSFAYDPIALLAGPVVVCVVYAVIWLATLPSRLEQRRFIAAVRVATSPGNGRSSITAVPGARLQIGAADVRSLAQVDAHRLALLAQDKRAMDDWEDRLAAANRQMRRGVWIAVVGALIGVGTYVFARSMGGGIYLVTWGLVLIGILIACAGAIQVSFVTGGKPPVSAPTLSAHELETLSRLISMHSIGLENRVSDEGLQVGNDPQLRGRSDVGVGHGSDDASTACDQRGLIGKMKVMTVIALAV